MENITVFRVPFPVSFEDDDEATLPKYDYTFDARNLSESDIMEQFVNRDENNRKYRTQIWLTHGIQAGPLWKRISIQHLDIFIHALLVWTIQILLLCDKN